ncbi:hypothetical protein ZOSMA_36G00100 [Zostera marina]|uniref:C2 domain-containing protein n=1 Tax=Zostera marina TaxID=29655 RepID=A0A0K9P5W4_ZOSMR|nr:hypothetical protein ZOSMA_36G00100 [Zostera marina]
MDTTVATARPIDIDLDLSVTIVSAKHLKNVNWRHGQLKPYAVMYLVSDNHTNSGADFHDNNPRFATKPDDAGSICPVWNEKFSFPISGGLINFSTLVIDIFHSKPSETPKPLVGTVRCALRTLLDKTMPIATLELKRPSGRPQGKVRIKFSSQLRPLPQPANLNPRTTEQDYYLNPHSRSYYNTISNPTATTPPENIIREHRTYVSPLPPVSSPYHQYGTYGDSLYGGYYYSTAPVPISSSRMTVIPSSSSSYYQNRASSSYGGPSAPVVDYEQRSTRNGLASVGSVAGAFSGLSLEQGLKYEEDNIEDYRRRYY